MDTFNANGEVENGRITFQLKATDDLKRSADGTVTPVRLEWRDLLSRISQMALSFRHGVCAFSLQNPAFPSTSC